MKSEYSDVLHLVNAAINNENYIPNKQLDWDRSYTLLLHSRLSGVVYDYIDKLPTDHKPPVALLQQWRQAVFQRGFKQIFANQELLSVLKKAQANNLNFILFKGLTLANLYPNCNMRFSSDADILVTPKQRPAAENLLLELGYTKYDDASKNHVPVYRIAQQNRILKIELHDCLWEDYTGKQADILNSFQLSAPDKCVTHHMQGVEITTLGYTEHLIYQIFHMAKHFAFESLPLKYLTDITLYINTYFDKIDFNVFWDCIRKLQYECFCLAIFDICRKYLGLNSSFYTWKDSINENLLADILENHNQQINNTEHWAATDLLASYFMHEHTVASQGWQQKLSLFFPSSDNLKEHFAYAKKYKFLLPIAWIHRFFSALKYSLFCKLKGQSASSVLNKAQYRLSLLKELNMVKITSQKDASHE